MDVFSIAVVIAAASGVVVQLQVAREQIATAKKDAAYGARVLDSLGVVLDVSKEGALACKLFGAHGTREHGSRVPQCTGQVGRERSTRVRCQLDRIPGEQWNIVEEAMLERHCSLCASALPSSVVVSLACAGKLCSGALQGCMQTSTPLLDFLHWDAM